MLPEEDPRMAVMDGVVEQNAESDRKYEREQEEGQYQTEMQEGELEVDEALAELEKEDEDDANQIETNEEFNDFLRRSPEGGGCGDLYDFEKGAPQQGLIDRVEVSAKSRLDYRTWKDCAEEIREQKSQLENKEMAPQQANRENVMTQGAAQAERVRKKEIADFEASQQEVPQTRDGIVNKFAAENPDFSAKDIKTAENNVYDQFDQQYIKTGYYPDNSWKGVYAPAGQHAKNERYLSERNRED